MCLNADMKFKISYAFNRASLKVVFGFVCSVAGFFVAAFWFGCVCLYRFSLLLSLLFFSFEREGGVNIKITAKG